MKISDSISMTIESNYLFFKNREIVRTLLSKEKLDQNDIINIFVALHIVLEIGINNFFRKIITPTFKKAVDVHKMIDNLDNINFIDKTVMFIYYSKFNFTDLSKATKYHELIGKMRSFSEMRNKLLHGHSISEISVKGTISRSKLKKNLNHLKLKEQIENFKFILEGLNYYADCFEINGSGTGIKQYAVSYLNDDFIPDKINYSS